MKIDSHSRRNRPWAFGAGALAIVLAASQSRAQTTETWNAATSGDWTDASDWNPMTVPNNGNPVSGDTYNAVISATGAAYTITLDSDITVTGLTLSSANATLLQTSGSTFTAGASATAASITAGTYEIDDGTLSGSFLNVGTNGIVSVGANGSATLDSTALNGAGTLILNANAVLTAQNGTAIGANISFRGASALLNASQDMSFGIGTGLQVIDFDASGDALQASNQTLTFGAKAIAVAISGSAPGGVGGPSITAATITNGGELSSSGTNSSLSVTADTSGTNNGTFEALDGGKFSLVGVDFTNSSTGVIEADTTAMGVTAGSTLLLSGATPGTGFTNAGKITGDHSATITLSGIWHNTNGTITLAGSSVLNLAGTFATSDIGTITRDDTNGATAVNITGSLNNASATLALTATTGSYNLAGGTITGGTVTQSGGAMLTYVDGGTLSGVTVNGGANLGSDSLVTLQSGAIINGAIAFSGVSPHLVVDENATFTGQTVTFNGTGSSQNFGIAANRTVTLATATVSGGGTATGALSGIFGDPGATLINESTIDANLASTNQGSVPGIALNVEVPTFTNSGGAVAEATNGGVFIIAGVNGTSDWSNAGSIKALDGSIVTVNGTWSNTGSFVDTTTNSTGSTLNLGGSFDTASIAGHITRDSASVVNLAGALDNTGASLTLSSSTGIYNFARGTITGGSIQTGGSYFTFDSGTVIGLAGSGGLPTLSGVALSGGGIESVSGSSLTFQNGSTLSGAYQLNAPTTSLIFDENATLGTGSIAVTPGVDGGFTNVSVTAGHTLTIGSNFTVSGGGLDHVGLDGAGAVVNQGTINANVANTDITIGSGSFSNSGALLVTANNAGIIIDPAVVQTAGRIDLGNASGPGSITLPSLALNGGSLIGSGTLTASGGVTAGDGGIISPGHSPGSITIAGELTFESGSELDIQLAGTTAGTGYDVLNQTGTASLTLGGKLVVSFLNGFQTDSSLAGDTFSIVTSGNALTGEFENAVSGSRLTTADGQGSFLVTYASGSKDVVLSQFQPVPEPSAWLLLVSGGAGLAFYRRRRK